MALLVPHEPMQRRMDDRIRQLCREVVAETDSEKAQQLAEEIRSLLRKHAADLRFRIANHLIVERSRKADPAKRYILLATTKN